MKAICNPTWQAWTRVRNDQAFNAGFCLHCTREGWWARERIKFMGPMHLMQNY